MTPVEESRACDKDYSTQVAFQSITSEFSLFCSQGHVKELTQTVTLFGASVLSSLVMMFQNRFGSKNILLLTFGCLAVPGFVCTVFVSGLVAKVGGVLLLWVYSDIILILTPVYANELLVEPFRNISNSVFRIMHGLGGALGTWMTLHLRDYRYIVCVYFAGYLVYNLLLMLTLPQSPSYLLKQQRAVELREAIARIASVNRFPGDQLRDTMTNLERIIESRA